MSLCPIDKVYEMCPKTTQKTDCKSRVCNHVCVEQDIKISASFAPTTGLTTIDYSRLQLSIFALIHNDFSAV